MRRIRARLCELEISYLWKPGPLRLVDDATATVLQDIETILRHLTAYEHRPQPAS